MLVIVTSSSLLVIFFLPSLPGPMLLGQHLQNISCTSLSHCDMEYHESAIASFNGTIDTTCHWVCKNMNFSVRLSFHINQNEAIISPDSTCLLNINQTLLCERSITNNYDCNITCDNFENQCVYTSITFWIFILLWCLGEISYYTSLGISDAICFGILGETLFLRSFILGQTKQLKYGKQRLWAAMGYGVAACLSGYMVDLWSHDHEIYKNYTSMLIPAVIFICIDLICCIKLKMSFESGSTTIVKDVITLLKSKSIIIFLCFATFFGILDSIKRNFLLWYVEDLAVTTNYMSKIKLIEGLITLAEIFGGEVVFLFFSGKIIEKLGYTYTLIFCFVCYAFRLGLISLSSMPWWILPIELLLHGPSYALCIATIIAYANSITPPGASATIQGLVQSVHDGFASICLYKYDYTFTFCFICYALRLGLISLAPTLWWILFIEFFMQGPSYALSFTTVISYGNVITPTGASSTVQGLVQGMYEGLGLSIGSLISGILFKKFGGIITLRIFSVFAAFSALTYFILHILYFKQFKHETDTRNNIKWRELDDAQRYYNIADT
ncbi:Major facilitator superfamily domain-containing protein 6 [Trachymyrmex zeteki]|uniref:Major facilitator superfamily domain-containing protein 6 n=1 Tax=Mycetomoellerius zeteki TaxID=64791 RepID=A0A151WEQ4_9HYME|nr:Major facilitator superfamily domain-containing protein 6 [Trachymyrmex zeteki]